MPNLKVIAKCIDQPIFLSKIEKKMPHIIAGTAAGFWAIDSFAHRKDSDNKKKMAKSAIILSSIATASIIMAKGLKLGGKVLIPRLSNFTVEKDIIKRQSEAVDKFVSQTGINSATLEKSKNKFLKPKEVEEIFSLPESKEKDVLVGVLFPKSENMTSKEIFSEIGRLSLMGAIPVLTGIGSGVLADKVTNDKSNVVDKIKEGFYQYFSNIFLCNVGAGVALLSMEQMSKKGIIKNLTPQKKMAGILTGIAGMGIIGGSAIANYLSSKIINPMFGQKDSKVFERHPEPLDICLHADDIATTGLLSGLKWIEPALPLMYMVSGYRAGIGYRNNLPEPKMTKHDGARSCDNFVEKIRDRNFHAMKNVSFD